MTEEQKALREAVARAIYGKEYDAESYPFEKEDETVKSLILAQADAAIAVVLERAARVAEPGPTRCDCISKTETGGWICECDCSNSGDYADAMAWCRSANNAAAIRALIKEK